MIKRLLALALALTLCLTILTGCGKKQEETPVEFDFAASYEKYDPETVVMTVNGSDVTWAEFYYMIYTSVAELQYYLGDIIWSKPCMDSVDVTFEEYTMRLTVDALKQYRAFEKEAADRGLVLTQEDQERLAADQELFMRTNCGEDATEADLEQFLMDKYFLNLELYRYINSTSVLYEKLFQDVIGAEGEKITDQQIQAFVDQAPYVTAKHILIKTIDENKEELPEEAVAAAKEQADSLRQQLLETADPKEREELFDQLMVEHSQDEGLLLFPNGYTFTTDEMYKEFETAAFDLEDYEISPVVKSQAGYHIILRVPTTRDSQVDFDYQNGVSYTVATYAATHYFSKQISQWMDQCEVQWSEAFEGITAEEIFAIEA